HFVGAEIRLRNVMERGFVIRNRPVECAQRGREQIHPIDIRAQVVDCTDEFALHSIHNTLCRHRILVRGGLYRSSRFEKRWPAAMVPVSALWINLYMAARAALRRRVPRCPA